MASSYASHRTRKSPQLPAKVSGALSAKEIGVGRRPEIQRRGYLEARRLPSQRSLLRPVDQTRELGQRRGGLKLAAALEAKGERMVTRVLEIGIGERPRFVQRPSVPEVAGVEATPRDKSFESQALTRHVEAVGGLSGDSLP